MHNQPRLSKSRFLSGYQCHLRLWNDYHATFQVDEPSTAQLAVFSTGQEVGELACKRLPTGRLISHDHRHFDDALSDTKEALEKATAPALFEAAFEFDGLIARADIIERLSEGGWRLIEVKSTLDVKEIHKLDFAFQSYILRNAGLDVREGGVLTLNKDYVYDGQSLDLDALFRLHDLINYADDMVDVVAEFALELQSTITQAEAPVIAVSDHCFDPYPCPYYHNCAQNVTFPEHGIAELGRLSKKLREEIQERAIDEVGDIPSDFSLNKRQEIIRLAVVEDRPIVHYKNLAAIDAIEQPIHYLDFETFAPAIPRFAGTTPYETIPFLFSLHSEREGREHEHTEYLHEENTDPRPQLTEHLIRAVGNVGAICTFSKYERSIIDKLRVANPEYAHELAAIRARLVDLLDFVRRGYYHPDFQGSLSLKRILPVLCPELGYDDLAIADGRAAGLQYIAALDTKDTKERFTIFNDLRKYCRRDTLATLQVRRALANIAHSEPRA